MAYVFLVIFLLLTGFFTFMVGGFFERGEASLVSFFIWHPWLYLFLVPAVGMRLWSEERRLGTHGAAADHAGHRLAGHRGQVPRLAGCSSALALALTFPVGDHRQLSRATRTTA